MRPRIIVYAIILIIIVLALVYMLRGLAQAPVWLLVLFILAIILLVAYFGRGKGGRWF